MATWVKQYSSVNDKLYSYIKGNGIKQSFICKKTGISHDKMSKILNNKRNISANELMMIANALNVSADIFLK